MMDIQSTKIKQKIEDYSRFLITLIVLSVYFYLGMIINTFIEPSDKSGIIVMLMLTTLLVAGWFTFLLTKWNKQLNNLLEQ